MGRRLSLLLLLAIFFRAGDAGAARPRPWEGAWTWDLCHEDRKPDHAPDTFCREGKDRILVEMGERGRVDLTLCPSDPWNERNVQLADGGRRLTFRTREGLDVRLRLSESGDRYTGRFVSRDGHAGRIQGRRVPGCGR